MKTIQVLTLEINHNIKAIIPHVRGSTFIQVDLNNVDRITGVCDINGKEIYEYDFVIIIDENIDISVDLFYHK